MKRKVSKQELEQFLTNYPRKLEMQINGMVEPPLCQWNDFSRGNWPESVVAGQSTGYEDSCYIVDSE